MITCTQWAARRQRVSWISLLLLLTSLAAASAHGSAYSVVMNTAGLNGQNATLAFDFLDGGPPSNTVSLSTLTSNGTQGSTSTSGDVTDTGGTGVGPWTFSDLGNTSFWNELLVDFALGTNLSFSFASTDDSSGGTPDSFSFLILDPFTSLPLVTTNDPTGANALFLLSIGQSGQALEVYAPDQQGVSITATAVPEPFTPALLAAGFAAMFARRRQR